MSTSTYYDFYGRRRSGQTQTPVDAPMPYQIASTSSTDGVSGNKTVTRYTRFKAGDGKVAMWREITVFDATTNDILSYTHEFTVAPWADRESNSLTWVPINECWDFPVQD